MAKKVQYRRLLWLAGLLAAAFAGLGYRLVDLQVVRHEELSLLAQRNIEHEELLEPRRGDILDVKGSLLATSLFAKTVCADPWLMGNRQAEVARMIAPILQLNEADLVKRLTPATRTNDKGETITNHYVVLKRKVPVETWEKLKASMLAVGATPDEKKLPAAERRFLKGLRESSVFADPVNDQVRVYPNGSLAAHVLGYVGSAQRELNGVKFTETTGRDGIELTLNEKLAGVHGWRVTETDRQRREQVPRRSEDVGAKDGLNVVLTIDSVLQHYLESALADAMEQHTPVSISGIIVRPRTGEILAMATLPNFDPNNPGAAAPDARRNRVITDVAEPGSTFKIVVVSGALNDGTVKLTDTFDCERGRFFYAGRLLHDHEPEGVLTVEGIITRSSNIGAAKIGIKMGENQLYEYIRDYGFGLPTGLPLPGEVGGIVHPVKKWSKVSIAQIPMGHGIAVTRMQMVMAMCAIANKGVLMRPMLVDRLEDSNHQVMAKFSPQAVRRVISEAAAEAMVTALKTVTSPTGTAAGAALEHYTVAGKTGTAQKAENGVYVHGKYFSSFIGFFPADNPEICISITMDEPKQGYYGGKIAAPVFKQVAERAAHYLNIHPEDSDGVPDGLASPAGSRAVKTAAVRPPQNP